MHIAVTFQNLPLVKLLDDFGGDATIKNAEEMCPIEMAEQEITEMREFVTHFMS